MSEGRENGHWVVRETVVEVDAETAWAAISDAAMLALWLADEVDLVPIEGAPASFTVDGAERPGRVERVEEGRELSFTWEREAGRPSLVELQLTPCVSGVRIEVTETDLGFGPRMAAMGWAGQLSKLASLRVLAFA